MNLRDSAPISRTNKNHLPNSISVNPDFYKELEINVVQGEDAVNLDKEMSMQAKNVLAYNTLSTIIRNEFQMLDEIIREGGK